MRLITSNQPAAAASNLHTHQEVICCQSMPPTNSRGVCPRAHPVLINRMYFGCLLAIAAIWAIAYGVDLRHGADDRAFMAAHPGLFGRNPTFVDERATLDEWKRRSLRHLENQSLRMNLVFAGAGLTLLWVLVGTISTERSWRRHNAPNREPDPRAGEVIDQLRGEGGVLTASAVKPTFLPAKDRQVVVDTNRQVVEFRGCTFVTRFAGNRPTPTLVLPFADIIGGRPWVSHGQMTISLRTTAGTVGIGGLQSMPALASVLLDIAEVNRRNPERYAAALAREPRVRTPAWAWSIPIAVIALVAFIAWRVFR